MKTRIRINWNDCGMNEEFYAGWQGVASQTINKKMERHSIGEKPTEDKEIPAFPLNSFWTNNSSEKSQNRFTGEEITTERATVRGGRRCAICGKQIRETDLCNKHFKEYGPKENYPDWVKELIRIESHTQRYVEFREVVNSARSNENIDFLADSELNHILIENKYEGVIPGATRKLKKHKSAL
jgi:hypothetical protein